MPNATKARERDSRLLLEDLPLQGPLPVDPKLIPRRNPSEDAKRLGLSNKVPPLPPQPGSIEAAQRVQANLQAYHAALAEAANAAAAEGRFLRVPSGRSEGGSGRSGSVYSQEEGSSQPSMVTQSTGGGEDGEEAAAATQGGAVRDVTDGTDDVRSLLPNMDFASSSPPKLSFDFGFDALGLSTDATTDDDNAYDDFLADDDDDIVAAANAEALASDDDGFYGQEFGFYAKARPNSGDLTAVNGGYFGPDGDDGLARNKSQHEPNLTPITERSEFSTRNSFVGHFGPSSAGGFGGAAGVSPALARMPLSPLTDGEISSFDQLRRLRMQAFGGSQGSLGSEGRRGSQGSLGLGVGGSGESPTLSVRSAGGLMMGGGGGAGGAPMAFGYSTDSSGSSNQMPLVGGQQQQQQQALQESPHSASSSGLLPLSASADPSNNANVDVTPKRPVHGAGGAEVQPHTPLTARKLANHSAANKPLGHSRNSSGADSVNYVKEEDPNGTGPPRWVMERRRTSEQGQLELVAREIVGWI